MAGARVNAMRSLVGVASPGRRTYAVAGIPHFWRVESDGGRPVVLVHELDPATGGYGVAGIHHTVL